MDNWSSGVQKTITSFTYDLTTEQMCDWAAAMGIEAVVINKDTNIRDFKRDLMLGNIVYR